MSDGEQHKGQVAEARRLAVKEGLCDLTVLVDLNGIQISGRTSDVMPVRIADDFRADGWAVIEVDGHDIQAVYSALAAAVNDAERPTAILAYTVIGKGVSFMENQAEFHGRGLTTEEYELAMSELGLEPKLDRYRPLRAEVPVTAHLTDVDERPELIVPGPRTYTADTKTDNRSAWGAALTDIAMANPDVPVAVLDCDLAVSVKTDGFAAARPDGFVQCGVGEHNAATVSGALSTCGVLTYWSDFGVFGVDEAYNQQRLNDINGACATLAVTHCGLDVGEDGKTHQCLDYVSAFRNFFGWKLIVPADPNQTDRAVRAAATMQGNVAIAMGRSKLPVIVTPAGTPLFGADYVFEYGRTEWARRGPDGVVLVMGTLSGAAVAAADLLAEEGVRIAVGVVACPLDLDPEAMVEATEGPWVLCVEDHSWRTGLWASVAEWIAHVGAGVRAVPHGVTGYQSSGAAVDLLAAVGLDAAGIADAVRELLA